MAAPTAYLTKANTAAPILEAIKKAGVPDKFTYDFLSKQLGFTSSSDRPMIAVLKALRFLDDSGVPLDRYQRYRDPAQSGSVLAEGLRDAYSDVFAANQEAQGLTVTQLKGIFARVAGKGDSVSQKMAATFKVLADLADWETPSAASEIPKTPETQDDQKPPAPPPAKTEGGVVLHHDVHIHLPVSTEIAVYDAIFRSMRDNLGV